MTTLQQGGSQFPPSQRLPPGLFDETEIDPRVVPRPTASTGASSGVKNSGAGEAMAAPLSTIRKRAFRRARRRAELKGATWYRGEWRSAHSLGTSPDTASVSTAPTRPAQPARTRTAPRLRVMTYNMGGLDPASYDVFCDWLQQQRDTDIILAQELHWGCGKDEASWTIGGWHAIISPDPKQRYSGTGVFVSGRVASSDQIAYNTIIPGRLLHVRCTRQAVTLDLIAGYQHVWQEKRKDAVAKQRHTFWTRLGVLLHSLPVRNLLIMGCDLNSGIKPIPGLIGRGVLHTSRVSDPELEAIINTHHLVLLNTWGRATSGPCHTFKNGKVRTQLDFLITRRLTADAESRRSAPIALDLMPWRQGPKHRPVLGSLLWVAGWTRARPRPAGGCSLPHLRQAILAEGSEAQQLRVVVRTALTALPDDPALKLKALNQAVIPQCAAMFPRKPANSRRPRDSPLVKSCVANMWQQHRALKRFGPSPDRTHIWGAWRQYAAFKASVKQLQKTSRLARKAHVETLIQQAEQASQKQDQAEVYRVINQLAPKKRVEKVPIRSVDGKLLDKQQEFTAIYEYFSKAFSRTEQYSRPSLSPLSITPAEVQHAIKLLKNGKAVPPGSMPAELWKLCPEELSEVLSTVLASSEENDQYPAEVVDCSLSLLPKPNKPTRLPKDLRPLGLQDPSAKLLAVVLRTRLLDIVQERLRQIPQFAYCPQKAIDQAISRVAQHCHRVREVVKHSTVSTHDRREGLMRSQCTGGLMISLDLSRAFDLLSRSALDRSLQAASVPEDLRAAILAIHESCRYSVAHGTYCDTFDLQVGVRQGCALSPLLYALYTAWLFERIASETSAHWAQHFLTIFADDKHLAWEVTSIEELQFVCKCVQVTYRLLQDSGMQVNPEKSKIVVALRGSAAARWLRKHTQRTPEGTFLDLGTPHQPLRILQVSQIVYLGVVASYTGFEMQTFKHRQRAAAQNRQRLLKLFHSRVLSQGQRVRLYRACVVSSLLYGLHAVGITAPVLRALEATDARALRALVRSPAHLYHETTDSIRARLKVPSPGEMLQKLLNKRCKVVQEPALQEWFQIQIRALTAKDAAACTPPEVHLSREGIPGVPCPVCGIVCVSHQHMLSHFARKHKPEYQEAQAGPAKDPRWYMQHADAGHVTEPEVKVASAQEGSHGLRNPTPQTCPPGEPESVESLTEPVPVLAENPEFRRMSMHSWQSVLRKPEYCKSLSTYCALCGQWAERTGFKQHIRLKHAESHAVHARAVARSTQLGLIAISPSAMSVAMDTDESQRAAVAQTELNLLGLPRTAPPAAPSGPMQSTPLETAQEDWKDKDDREWQQARDSDWQSQKWRRPSSKGTGRNAENWSKRKYPEENVDQQGTLDKQTQVLLQMMTRMTLRHDQELCRIRSDTSFMLFSDVGDHGCLPQMKATAENWSELFTQGKVTCSLKVIMMLNLVKLLREALGKALQDETLAEKYRSLSWLVEGENALSPCWTYFEWNPAEKKEVRSQQAPLKHQEVLNILDKMDQAIPLQGVLTNFRNTKGMDQGKESEVIPFMISIGLRHPATADIHAGLVKLSGCSCMKLVGCRLRPDRGQRPQLAKQLEEAFQATSFCDWAPRRAR
ncbi:unnamed protein product [Symbiodinium sp. CCMP2592]|nr:unnamed protein product [Symbiodinium sp. CCMP2592]